GVRGFGQLDIGSSFALAGSFAYQDAREGRSEIGGNVDAAERIAFEKTGAEVNGAYEFNRIRLRVRGSTTSYDYQDLELNSGTTVNLDGRDFDETRLAASAEYAVGRDWAVLGEIEQVNREFDIIPIGGINRDIDGIVYRVGTNFELQNNLRGEITAGYLEFEPDDPAQPTQDGLALNANVQWFPTELTTLSARAGRDVADAGGVNASSVLVTQYGLGISHELMRNIVLFGDVAFEQREFDAIGLSREDDQTDLNAGATWKVNRNIHVVGGLGFTTRDSDFEPFDETRATVTLRLFP
ncbi:MAG: outer membrane beta-barrel protein, partial [Pseudomonadota bacterium]|nr:outer membrane beta-barrel protein [Pseudomonadota bacterium]